MANGDYLVQYVMGIPIGAQEGVNPSTRYILTVDVADTTTSDIKAYTVDGGTVYLAPFPDALTRNALITVSLADAQGRQWRLLPFGSGYVTQARMDDGRSWALVVISSDDASPANFRTLQADTPLTVVETGVPGYRVLLTMSPDDFSGTPQVRSFFGGLAASGAVSGGFALLTAGGGSADPLPDTYSGLQRWYDWDRSPLFTDTAGTTPAVVEGDLVARTNDLSANAAHATEVTAGARPTLRLAALNSSLNVIDLDGGDDQRVGSPQTLSTFHWFMYLKVTSFAANRNFLGDFDVTFLRHQTSTTLGVRDAFGNLVGTITLSSATPTDQWCIWEFRKSGTSLIIRRDGVQQANQTVVDAGWTFGLMFARASGENWLGSASTAFYYNEVRSDAEAISLRSYILGRSHTP